MQEPDATFSFLLMFEVLEQSRNRDSSGIVLSFANPEESSVPGNNPVTGVAGQPGNWTFAEPSVFRHLRGC